MLILIFLLSLLPSVLMYLLLRGRKKADSAYRHICSRAMLRGLFETALFVMLLSTAFYIVEIGIKLLGAGRIALRFYHNFVLLAFSEELVKFLMLRGLMKRHPYQYSALDVCSLMTIIGLGFEISEGVVYAFISNAAMMLVRGLTVMHGSYGWIMGRLLGKAKETGNRLYSVLAIVLPSVLHGTYDFCLSSEILEMSDFVAFIPVLSALASVVIIVAAVVTVCRERKGHADIPKAV